MTKGESRARSGVPGLGLRLGLLLGILATTALAACGDREPTGGEVRIGAGQFVEIIVALRTAEREVERTVPPDSVQPAFARRKSEILARHGVTEEDVRAFVERHHARPGFMVEVWDTIAQRLRSQPPDADDDLTPLEELW